MVASFAVRADLELAIKRTFTVAEQPWADDLLAQASDHLRSEVLGWQVYPAASMSYTTRLQAGMFHRFPQHPATFGTVTYSDTSGPVPAAPVVFDGGFIPTKSGIATLTVTAGYAVAPPVLRSWCIVLAAQAVANVEQMGTLTADAYSSAGIDDFKVVWNQSGTSGWGIPELAKESLRARFNLEAHVTGG